MKRSAALFITILNCLLFSTGCKKNPPVAIPIPPTVTAISPVSGPAGTVVTITGTNFKTTAADNTVKFNGTVATVTSATGTTLTVPAPAGGTTGKVTVSTADGTATGPVFTYAIIPPPPTVTAISPVSGPAGTVVIITGTNFKTTTTDNTVKFNGTAATVQSATATSVTVAAPAGGTSGAVSVTTTDGTAAGPVFTYTTPPTITAISPVSGAAGTVVTITGTNFKTTAADNTVKFNGVAATVQTASATSLTVAAPVTGTTGAISVTTADGTAAGPTFTYVAGTDVYVVGQGITGWGYWKNGVFTAMPSNCAVLRSVFVDGTDVYVAGADVNYGPAYWKNGVIVTLPMTAGHNGGTANSVFVSGTDVYAAGFDMVNGSSALPRCWKNGTALPVSLSAGNISNGLPVVIGYVYQVIVSGSDVYMAGAQSPFSGNQVATWWKNGTPNPLTDGTSVCEAKGIALSGSDVYVTSNDGTIPKYWKNGVATVLNTPNNAYSANPTGIYVSGADVYVSGYYRNVAKYWKGSTLVDLTATIPGGINYEYATGIAGKGTDIYICGNDIAHGYGYWKNGVFTSLPGVSNIINGIFVK